MKDTYWLLLGFLGIAALGAWAIYYFTERRLDRERTFRHGPGNPQSIWTTDLFMTRWGRIFATWVVAPGIAIYGIVGAVSQEISWRRFTYHGFDAVCFGLGLVCLGTAMCVGYMPPALNERAMRIRLGVVLGGFGLGAGLILTAALRNF